MYKCRLHHQTRDKIPETRDLHQTRDRAGLYLKTIFHQKGSSAKTRTCHAVADRRVIDFSQEHSFRLETGRAFSILMQVKRKQGIGKKSEWPVLFV